MSVENAFDVQVDLEDDFVRLVDEDLSDEQLTERLISGGA
jgi:hypothetical protein